MECVLKYYYLVLFVTATQVFTSNAWLVPDLTQSNKESGGGVAAASNPEAGLAAAGNSNSNSESVVPDIEDEEVPDAEAEAAENEQNFRCAQSFDRNLRRILKSVLPADQTKRTGRQDAETATTDELVQSMLNLDFQQVLGPVLKLMGAAASNNASAIDESYNTLPLAVRSGVTDLIKFAIDLIALETEGLTL